MKTKIGTEVAHVTRDSGIIFKVKRSKVNLQGWGYCSGLPQSLLFRHRLSYSDMKCIGELVGCVEFVAGEDVETAKVDVARRRRSRRRRTEGRRQVCRGPGELQRRERSGCGTTALFRTRLKPTSAVGTQMAIVSWLTCDIC